MQIVDLATLTGACRVALGPSIAGINIILQAFSKCLVMQSLVSAGIGFLKAVIYVYVMLKLFLSGVFTPSDDLAKEVFAASEISGEKFWRLPMEESYWESMKSGIADMLNTGARQGGSITAALFLK